MDILGTVRSWSGRAGGAMSDAFQHMPKLPTWWKGKDKTAERRAVAARTPRWLVAAPFVLGAGAMLGEALFMSLFVIRSTGNFEWSLEWVAGNVAGLVPRYEWSLQLQLSPLLFGFLFFASLVIIGWSMLWIPMYLALAGHGRTVRLVLLATGLFCNGLVLAGGFHGQNTNRLEDIRTEEVAVRELDAAVSAAQTRVDTIDHDLGELRGPNDLARPSIQMQACRLGADGWAGVVRQAQSDANINAGVIARASEVAARCDQLRGDRGDAIAALNQARQARQTAVSVREVAAQQSDEATGAASWIDEWRPFGISAGLSMIAIFAFWVGNKMSEARALYDPSIEEPKLAADPVDTPAPAPAPDEPALGWLELPPLPDLRAVAEEDFDRLGPVDEQGRRLRRVGAHYRPESPAPRSGRDRRRPAAPAAAGVDDGAQQTDTTSGADAVNFDDLLERGMSGGG